MTKNVNQIAKAMKIHYNLNEEKLRHMVSVYTLAKTIGELEKLPEQTQEYLEIEALMCDIDDKECSCEKCEYVKELMKNEQLDYDIIDRVSFVIENFCEYDRITGLDHQILLEAHMIVEFKEKNYDTATIVNKANAHFLTNYGKAFLKRAFNV